MNIEKGKISNSQLTFLLTGRLQGTVFLLSYVTNLAGHDTWLTILSGLAVIIPFGLICALISKRFPGLNFVQVNKIVYGRYLGTIISMFYLSYFLFVLSVDLKDAGDFYKSFFIGDTPLIIIITVFACVCAYAVWNGLEILARIAPFVVTLLSLIIIATVLMLLPQMDFSKFQPCGELSLIDFLHSTHIIAEISFGITLTTVLPIMFAVNDYKHTARAFLSSLVFAAAFFVVIAVRNTAVLGNVESLVVSSSFQSIKVINIGFLTRMDILFGVGHTFGIFLVSSMAFYSTVLLLSQILGLRTYKPMIFPTGCIAIIIGLILYPSATAHLQSAQNVEIISFVPFIFIFPSLSLFIAKIRNLPKKGSL